MKKKNEISQIHKISANQLRRNLCCFFWLLTGCRFATLKYTNFPFLFKTSPEQKKRFKHQKNNKFSKEISKFKNKKKKN